MTDYRLKILENIIKEKKVGSRIRVHNTKEFEDLLHGWNNNNMLYNSLMFYKLYHPFHIDIEKNKLVINDLICEHQKTDIMNSWWTPVKWFIFRTSKGSRDALTNNLLKAISKGNTDKDISDLIDAIMKLRNDSNCVIAAADPITVSAIKEMLQFLNVVYSLGNMTDAAFSTRGKFGALDSWDAKLAHMKENNISTDDWVRYVERNHFECYFTDSLSKDHKEYQCIQELWPYGGRKLGMAKEEAWKNYFCTVREKIEMRMNSINLTAT